MTTINTIQDLMRILDENPEWLEEVRSRVLTRELLDLPDRVTQLSERVAQLSDRLTQLSEEVSAFAVEMRAFAAKTDRRFDLVDKRFDRMENSIGRMKGAYAEGRVSRQADIIADQMGFTWVRTWSYEDIRDLVHRSDRSDIPFGDIRSFRDADIISESTDREGETHYIPVEVSFTADARDTNRALRNARLMKRFTASPAHPAVAGLRKDDDILELFESGAIHWYQLDDEDFEAH